MSTDLPMATQEPDHLVGVVASHDVGGQFDRGLLGKLVSDVGLEKGPQRHGRREQSLLVDHGDPSIQALEKVYPMHMWCFPAEDAERLQALSAEDLEPEDSAARPAEEPDLFGESA